LLEPSLLSSPLARRNRTTKNQDGAQKSGAASSNDLVSGNSDSDNVGSGKKSGGKGGEKGGGDGKKGKKGKGGKEEKQSGSKRSKATEHPNMQDFTLSGPSPNWENIASNSSLADWDVLIRVQSDSLQNPENQKTDLKGIVDKGKF